MELARLSKDGSGDYVFKNAKWHPLDVIDCEVQFVETGEEWFEYTASPDDEVDQGRELYEQLTTTYIDQVAPVTDEDREALASAELMSQRYGALKDSDWIACNDVQLENQVAWLEYRQAWRDITSQEGYPLNVIIPEKPLETPNTFRLPDRSRAFSVEERKRARNADGTFRADDPSTSDINEAWEDGRFS